MSDDLPILDPGERDPNDWPIPVWLAAPAVSGDPVPVDVQARALAEGYDVQAIVGALAP